MLIDRKIERYVREATSYLPGPMRAKADKDITGMIRDMVTDHAEGRQPDVLDVREVLRAMGSPEDTALSWYASNEDELREGETALRDLALPLIEFFNGEQTRNSVSVLVNVFMAASVCLVGIGLVALGTHTINSMLPIFIGCIMALAAAMGRGVLIGQTP